MILLTPAMAAVAEMGEVDEIHSKEEGVVVNGDISAVHMDDETSQEKPTAAETTAEASIMDVDDGEVEEIKDAELDEETLLEDSDKDDELLNEEEDGKVAEDESVHISDEEAIEEKDKSDSEAEAKDNKSGDSDIVNEINDDDDEDDIHEINDDDDEEEEEEDGAVIEDEDANESESETKSTKQHETIELNDSGEDGDNDGDVICIENTTPTANGTAEKMDVDEILDLDTPEKSQSSRPKLSITPRRSTRNLNKSKSYAETFKAEVAGVQSSEESDIEEILPQDPLACGDSITVERIRIGDKPRNKPMSSSSSTIVVKDTKRLVEIAAKSNSSNSSKKEPTLVIIDTNSILSGRGAVPMSGNKSSMSSSYSTVLPMALPAQGMYPANMRATITPIPLSNSSLTVTPKNTAPLLPTLTDDMFVVEAPSFIVPYVYEKPPVTDFKEFVKDIKESIQKQVEEEEEDEDDDDDVKEIEEIKKDETKPYSYFESPLGKFFIDIGFNLVQEYVQSDLLRQQKRKREREGGQNPDTDKTIQSLIKNLEYSKENNEPFKMPIKRCEFCSFKTESALAMSYHLETPHMKNFVYRCNFCTYEVRSPHDILFHMEAMHTVRGHLERAPAFHQCPSCPFEDNQKGKLSRHAVACARKFKPEHNLNPPMDWEPPAKIPRVPKMRQQGLTATAAAYQAMSKNSQYQFLSKMQLQSTQQTMQRGRGRPTLGNNTKSPQVLRPSGMVFKQQSMSGGSVLVPTNYQLSGNQVFQSSASSGKKPVHQPSISITPLPRASTTITPTVSSKPGENNSKNSFVICEICDGYIKDLEQLRNHMQWIHKIKIHPKMIYNRPPLNCQKCQFRFFTDQGLERHLLGSHGLVTSSMQDAANKSKDSGRCPVCGRVYQWKLLNHVARDHNMTLKPAHLSYKCTVCTATFGMYKQFENHVYSAHSVVAKRVMDKKTTSSSSSIKSDIKPLKINDEITIIPQPAKSTNGASKEGSPSSSTGSSQSRNSTPSTSKNADSTTPSTSRAERLARRNASGDE